MCTSAPFPDEVKLAFGTQLLQARFPKSREALDRFLVTGEQWEGELVHTRKDGTQVIVESRQVVTRNSQNRPLAILEINRDITERKQRERENQAQYRIGYVEAGTGGPERWSNHVRCSMRAER
jgi:hypothetical protein